MIGMDRKKRFIFAYVITFSLRLLIISSWVGQGTGNTACPFFIKQVNCFF